MSKEQQRNLLKKLGVGRYVIHTLFGFTHTLGHTSPILSTQPHTHTPYRSSSNGGTGTSTVAMVVVLVLPSARAGHLRRRQGARRKYNIPPGPRPWPVIGNLNLIGALPYRSIRDLSRRYGPLMSLRFGSFPVVVGSSVDMARYFLRANDLAFLDRPRTAAGRYTVYNYAGVLWSHYGEYWRQARRLWVTELLSARRLASTEHVRAEEVRAMLRGLSRRAGAGTAVVLKEHMLMVTLNVISRMVFGKKYIVEEGEGSSPTTAEEFRLGF